MSKINLMQGDCIELMKNIPDKSVDLILCDLPYGTTDCKWDCCIDLEKLWKEYKRILTDTGVVALFGDNSLFMASLLNSNKSWFKYNWIWKKRGVSGGMAAKFQPLRCLESISVFYKKTGQYYPQMEEGKPYKGTVHTIDSEVYTKSGQRKFKDNDGTRFPILLLDKKEFDRAKQGRLHPSEKPVALLEYLIKTYTTEGMTVLDNTFGSGSTGVAAVNLNRDFIGIELDPEYFAIGKKRIEDRLKELKKDV